MLFRSSTHTVNQGWQAKGSCACAHRADRGNSRGVVKQSTTREKHRRKSERGPALPVQLGFLPLGTIMLVSPPSYPLRCPLPGRWMALVTVQRSPTPSTSSSPCVSVRAAFIVPPPPTLQYRLPTHQTQTFWLWKIIKALVSLCIYRLLPVIKCLAFVVVRMRGI